jgi:hypothetical protein
VGGLGGISSQSLQSSLPPAAAAAAEALLLLLLATAVLRVIVIGFFLTMALSKTPCYIPPPAHKPQSLYPSL